MSALFLPLEIRIDVFSFYNLTHLVFALSSFIIILFLIKKDGRVLARPAFVMGVLFHIMFQWTLALYSLTFENSLTHYWFFSLCIQTVVLTALLWTYLTPQLNPSIFSSIKNKDYCDKSFIVSYVIGCCICILFLLIYFHFIPFRCTALYALIYEPYLTTLAREVSGKLSNTNIPFYINGALINVIYPLLVYQSLVLLLHFIDKKKFIINFIFLILLFALFSLIYITGAKGNFIPTLILLIVTTIVRGNKFRIIRCIFITLSTLMFGSILMISIEFLKERSTAIRNLYDIGYCAQMMGACEKTNELLVSLKARDDSLGFDNRVVLPHLQEQMERSCPAPIVSEAPAPIVSKAPAPIVSEAPAPIVSEAPTRLERSLSYLHSLFYRSFGVPIQVASWHFKYVEEFGSPGKYALPLSSYLFGKTEVPSIKINQIYGSKYSNGAKVSTGTAPTSFLLAWPAYWGIFGLFIGVICLLAFDFIYSSILRKLHGRFILPIGVGFVYISCINFLSSSFETTLFSHAGLLGITIIYINYIYYYRKII